MIKQGTRLYTYVDPNADLSQGLLSARLAPEEALIRRYPGHGNKEEIIKRMDSYGDPYGRPDLIYALDAPIPDTASEKLRRFRDTHKLVSYDVEQIKDLIALLKRRRRKPPIEIEPDFEPRKRVQWSRDPKENGTFYYAPSYKVLTRSCRIPPELLREE